MSSSLVAFKEDPELSHMKIPYPLDWTPLMSNPYSKWSPTMILCSNELLKWGDNDGAIARRRIIIVWVASTFSSRSEMEG